MTEQEKREKVINGLECCLGDTRADLPNLCTICPYAHGSYATQTCGKKLREDALALLKAQEPVVMAGAELTDAELIEVIRKAPITLRPTIEAIPVEWLKKRRDIYLKSYHAGHECDLHTAAILNDTLMAWRKEQEART